MFLITNNLRNVCSRELSASQAEPNADLSRACNLAYSNVSKPWLLWCTAGRIFKLGES